MDKLFIRKDVYDEFIEKGYGKRDLSKLQKVQITDKNGHKRNVYKKTGVEQKEEKQSKAQEELTPEKKAKYETMLAKVKAGPDENALLVGSKMLNKQEAVVHLEGKLGKTSGKNEVQKMADKEDKTFEQSEKDAQKKYGDMSIEELKAEAKKYDGVSKYSPEANEARKVYDILNQKLEGEKKNKTGESLSFKARVDKLKADGWDNRAAHAKVALDEIEEQLDAEKNPDTRKKLFDAMRDIQINGEQSKYIKERLTQGNKAAETEKSDPKHKKELDNLMKIGFDRRAAFAKVALDEISERLDTEKDKGIREKLFEDMRDVQINGLNAKYFENHKEDYGF